jgi:acetyl-CoA C-acetyltransferase
MKTYIVAARRTPIGCFNGAFKDVSAVRLGAEVVKSALLQAHIPESAIDEVIVGNVVGAGQGMGPGRQVALYAGLPDSVPAYTVNMVCGSGMKVVMDACAHIRAGDADLVMTVGTENMSQIPYMVSSDVRRGVKPGHLALEDLLLSDGITDVFHRCHMGITAENISQRLGISREEQDLFALSSQKKAQAAIQHGRFVEEIVPVEVPTRSGTETMNQDEYPKDDTSLGKLFRLRPAFTPEGTVTAGNASGLNDGASAILVASEEAVRRHQLVPLAEIESYSQAGIAPEIMGLGPVNAVNNALEKAGLTLSDMDLIECNEAFAGQSLGVMRLLSDQTGLDMDMLMERTNVNGGAIALGHPLGASGNRIIVTLLHEMRRRHVTHGLAAICIGGGMGTALILKNVP